VCGKRFKDSTAVRAHERTHSDERPYACPRCEKTFKTSECLWHHENRSKTCGKSLGELVTPRPCGGGGFTRGRRGRQSRRSAGARPLHLPTAVPVPLPPAHHVFRHHDAKIDVDAVMAAAAHLHHPLIPPHQQLHQQHQHPVYVGAISSSPSAQFAELAHTGAHHTTSPDQPQSGADFVNFDCASVDWDPLVAERSAECEADPGQPAVVKVEAAEIMDLLDYSLAAFNSDSLSSYPDVFDRVKIDPAAKELYEDEEEEDDDEDDAEDEIDVDFSQSHHQQQLAMHDINGHPVRITSISCCILQRANCLHLFVTSAYRRLYSHRRWL